MCKGADEASCLTAAQVETARMIYAAAMNPKTKREITGLEPGSELGWTDLGWTASARATGLEQFRFLVFGDPAWTVQKFNFDSDIVLAEERDNNTINALDPNLKPFIERRRQVDSVSRMERSADLHRQGPRSTTIAWRRRSAAETGSTAPIACSWRPAWDTAAAARGRTPSTCSRLSSDGSKAALRPIRSSRRLPGPRPIWTGRVRSVPIRKSLSTAAPAARTMRGTSHAV